LTSAWESKAVHIVQNVGWPLVPGCTGGKNTNKCSTSY